MAKKDKKHKDKKYWIGIDLGGTKLLTALLNRRFKVVSTFKTKVDVSKGDKHFLKTAEERFRWQCVVFIFIGACGSHTHTHIHSPHTHTHPYTHPPTRKWEELRLVVRVGGYCR